MKFVQCNCVTKTPDPKFHRRNCPVWLASRVGKLEKTLESTIARLHLMEQAGAFENNLLDQKVIAGIMKKIAESLDVKSGDGVDMTKFTTACENAAKQIASMQKPKKKRFFRESAGFISR